VTLPYNPNVGCPSGYHVHTNIDAKIDECSKNGNNLVDMLVLTPIVKSGNFYSCPAGFEGFSERSCAKHVQSRDGLCPLGTTAEPNQRGQCLTDNSLPGKTPSTQTGNSGGSGTTTTNTGTGGTTSTPMTTPMKTTATGTGTTTTTTSTKHALVVL
jgi:hypothetical protein